MPIGPASFCGLVARLPEVVDVEGYIYRRLGEAHQPVPLQVLEQSVEAAHHANQALAWPAQQSHRRP